MSRAMLHFGHYTLPDTTTRYACAVTHPDAPDRLLALVYARNYLIGTACRDFESELRALRDAEPTVSRFLDMAVESNYFTSEWTYAHNWSALQIDHPEGI